MMNNIKTVIIGAGPAGLAAACEIAKAGGQVVLLDENAIPGGQLFKQIHKFFGSNEHQAGTRGFNIGNKLLKETVDYGVKVVLNAKVYALYPDKSVGYIHDGHDTCISADRIIIATGGSENALAFPGCTLPGVMSAGAAQTMVNVNRVLPGKKALMVGAGNIGIIVAYQLLLAGMDVKGVMCRGARYGGYAVHAAKIRRAGVPILVSHTVKRAIGKNQVEAVEIVEVDKNKKAIIGSESIIDADTLCISSGLTPLTELAWMMGCEFIYVPPLGGHVPKHDMNMETTVPGIYIAGDASGIEEASAAMEEGRLAGLACAQSFHLLSDSVAEKKKNEVWNRLNALRTGQFGEETRIAKENIIKAKMGGE